VPVRARLLADARAGHRPAMQHVRPAHPVEEVARDRRAIHPPVTISGNLPTACDPAVIDSPAAPAAAVGARHRRMASGAGRDAAWGAGPARAGMTFIPGRDGRSHAPGECAENGGLAPGAAALLEAVQWLDRERPRSRHGTKDRIVGRILKERDVEAAVK